MTKGERGMHMQQSDDLVKGKMSLLHVRFALHLLLYLLMLLLHWLWLHM